MDTGRAEDVVATGEVGDGEGLVEHLEGEVLAAVGELANGACVLV